MNNDYYDKKETSLEHLVNKFITGPAPEGPNISGRITNYHSILLQCMELLKPAPQGTMGQQQTQEGATAQA